MKIAAYMTSWGPVASLANLMSASMHTMILSFARWDSNGIITGSDGILDIPQYNPYWMPPSYMAWTQFKMQSPTRCNVTVAFGGQTYGDIWDSIGTVSQQQTVARNLVKLLTTAFPVYMKNAPVSKITQCMAWTWDGKCDLALYQPVGKVYLDGLDFDLERDDRITLKHQDNLWAVVKTTREMLGLRRKSISLTGFSVAADPVLCGKPDYFTNCSYTDPGGRSQHCGELLPLLQRISKQLSPATGFDHIQAMTYDAGKKYAYKTAMMNYARAVNYRKHMVYLGNTINSQWGPPPGGSYTETESANIARSTWASQMKFGGLFMWNIGANTNNMTPESQISALNRMAAATFGLRANSTAS